MKIRSTHNSRIWLFRSLFALVAAVLLFTLPGKSDKAILLVCGLYFLADGILAINLALNPDNVWQQRCLAFGEGVASIITEAMLFTLSTNNLPYFLIAWGVMIGVLRLLTAGHLQGSFAKYGLGIVAVLPWLGAGLVLLSPRFLLSTNSLGILIIMPSMLIMFCYEPLVHKIQDALRLRKALVR